MPSSSEEKDDYEPSEESDEEASLDSESDRAFQRKSVSGRKNLTKQA